MDISAGAEREYFETDNIWSGRAFNRKVKVTWASDKALAWMKARKDKILVLSICGGAMASVVTIYYTKVKPL